MTYEINVNKTLKIYYRTTTNNDKISEIVSIKNENDELLDISDINIQNVKEIQWKPIDSYVGKKFDFDFNGRDNINTIKVVDMPDKLIHNYPMDDKIDKKIIDDIKSNANINLNFEKNKNNYLSFDGINDYGLINHNDLILYDKKLNNPHAFQFQLRTTNIEGHIFGLWSDNAGMHRPIWELSSTNDNKLRYRIRADDSSYPIRFTFDSSTLENGEWNKIMINIQHINDSNRWFVNINGKPISINIQENSSSSVGTFENDLAIAARNYAYENTIDNLSKFDIKNLRFYDKGLTDEEMNNIIYN